MFDALKNPGALDGKASGVRAIIPVLDVEDDIQNNKNLYMPYTYSDSVVKYRCVPRRHVIKMFA